MPQALCQQNAIATCQASLWLNDLNSGNGSQLILGEPFFSSQAAEFVALSSSLGDWYQVLKNIEVGSTSLLPANDIVLPILFFDMGSPFILMSANFYNNGFVQMV